MVDCAAVERAAGEAVHVAGSCSSVGYDRVGPSGCFVQDWIICDALKRMTSQVPQAMMDKIPRMVLCFLVIASNCIQFYSLRRFAATTCKLWLQFSLDAIVRRLFHEGADQHFHTRDCQPVFGIPVITL